MLSVVLVADGDGVGRGAPLRAAGPAGGRARRVPAEDHWRRLPLPELVESRIAPNREAL